MRRRMLAARVVAVWTACLSGAAWANNAPVVSNVTASQRGDGSKLVDIHYDLADADGDPCTVWISVSDDGGATWKVPAKSFVGDIGMNVSPGTNKSVVWDAGADFPGKTGTFRVRVWADDGNGPGTKVIVPAGWFPYQNTSDPNAWVLVDTFYIDKYEVTNSFYCQFLNAGGNDDHWDSRQEITRQGEAGNYYYTVKTGRENYPVRWVSYSDAEAFAQWRSNLEGVTYRLPTAYEWEKAAAWDPAANHYYIYGFHRDSIDCDWCNYSGCYSGPLQVGYFDGTSGRNNAKSFYGCYDMSGNLWEWTSEISGSYRVFRGGDWYSNAANCQCTTRNYGYAPSDRHSNVGFRLVLDPD